MQIIPLWFRCHIQIHSLFHQIQSHLHQIHQIQRFTDCSIHGAIGRSHSSTEVYSWRVIVREQPIPVTCSYPVPCPIDPSDPSSSEPVSLLEPFIAYLTQCPMTHEPAPEIHLLPDGWETVSPEVQIRVVDNPRKAPNGAPRMSRCCRVAFRLDLCNCSAQIYRDDLGWGPRARSFWRSPESLRNVKFEAFWA